MNCLLANASYKMSNLVFSWKKIKMSSAALVIIALRINPEYTDARINIQQINDISFIFQKIVFGISCKPCFQEKININILFVN